MAQRKYMGEPIDMTDLPGEKHISERDGKTVAGSSDDDWYDENTDAWPSALDRDDFTDLQAEIIEKLCLNPKASNMAIADMTEGSDTSVYNVKHKLSAMGHHGDVPFDIPDGPTASVKAAQPYMDDTSSNSSDSSEGGEAGNNADERDVNGIIKELYIDGMSCSEIADEVNLSEASVRGKIGALSSNGELNTDGEESNSDSQEEKTEKRNTRERRPKSRKSDLGKDGNVTLSIDSTTLAMIMENEYVGRGIKEELLESVV